jgi:hypothetical protein
VGTNVFMVLGGVEKNFHAVYYTYKASVK